MMGFSIFNSKVKLLRLGIFVLLIVGIFVAFSNIGKQQTTKNYAATFQNGAEFEDTEFASGMRQPSAMEFAPDGRLFVAEQTGSLRVIKNGQLLPTAFVTIDVDPFFEQGLLGIAFDPNFASNRFVYLYYTSKEKGVVNRVSRFTADPTNPDVAMAGSETILIDDIAADAGNHNAGAIHFGSDGKLYVATGDGGQNHDNSQKLGNLSGKILRVNADGSVPSDNPFVGQAGARGEIWALGLRNPFTFAFQPGTGKMFINDVGQDTWEEINEGMRGANYGWDTCEGNCSNANFVNPLLAYDRSTGNAIAGGVFYSGTQFPQNYQGMYFFADYGSGVIQYIDPGNPGNAQQFASGIDNPVDLKVGSDGALYYLSHGGQVGKIMSKSGSTNPQPTVNITLETSPTGLSVMLDGQVQKSPHTFQSVANSTHTIAVMDRQDFNGTTYQFISWSDGQAISHAITTPGTGTTYTARFEQFNIVGPGPSISPSEAPVVPSVESPGDVVIPSITNIPSEDGVTPPADRVTPPSDRGSLPRQGLIQQLISIIVGFVILLLRALISLLGRG